MADLYMGKYEKPATALIKILGPAIGIIKDKSDIREQAIMFGGQLGDSVIFENCETLFNRISKAYFSWNNSKKNFNDLGGKADSIRFRVTEEGFIGPTNKNPKIKYATDIRFKPLQFYIEKLQPVQEEYDEGKLLGKVLRAFRDMPDGEPTQITGRHPLEVSMYVWAAIYLDWLHAGRPNNKNDHSWYIDLFEDYLENERLSLVLYKCFRGAQTSDGHLLKNVAQECIDQSPYLDEPAELEQNEEGMDVEKQPEKEHVCDAACADLHFVESVSSEKFLQDQPVLKDILPLLKQRQEEYENAYDEETTESSSKDTDPVASSSTSLSAFSALNIASSKDADPVACAASSSTSTALSSLSALDNYPELKGAELEETLKLVKQAGYVATLKRIEDVSLLDCPEGFCRVSLEEMEELDVGKEGEIDMYKVRNCPNCRQIYHAVCRKANNNECIKCGYVGRRGEGEASSDEDESYSDDEEDDDGDESHDEEFDDVEMGDAAETDADVEMGDE